jgi:outer membrane protein, heavy metal efflux system
MTPIAAVALASSLCSAPTIVLETSTSSTGVTKPLSLKEVMDSAISRYPPLIVARLKQDVQAGARLAAEGGFDLKLSASGGVDPTGFYREPTAGIELRQPTPFWGLAVFGGYRYGSDVPIYKGGEVTAVGGEFQAGLVLPLWQDGPIDERRLALRLADVGVDVASLGVRLKELETVWKAAKAYWSWTATGINLHIARNLADLAKVRQDGIRRRVEGGDLAEIELVDNERLVLERQARVVYAEQLLEQAALELSMFVRNDTGRPRTLHRSQLPHAFPRESFPGPTTLQEALRRGRQLRPELLQLTEVKKGLHAELEFANNQEAPRIDAMAAVSQDVGDKNSYGNDPDYTSKNETQLGLKLKFELPIQRRKARGQQMKVEATIRQTQEEFDFLVDAITNQISSAHIALCAAYQKVKLSRAAVRLAKRLEQAERRRLELGQSNVLTVNLREEATVNARTKLLESHLSYQTALAQFQVASGSLTIHEHILDIKP